MADATPEKETTPEDEELAEAHAYFGNLLENVEQGRQSIRELRDAATTPATAAELSADDDKEARRNGGRHGCGAPWKESPVLLAMASSAPPPRMAAKEQAAARAMPASRGQPCSPGHARLRGQAGTHARRLIHRSTWATTPTLGLHAWGV